MSSVINRLVTAGLSVVAIATIAALDAKASNLTHPACAVSDTTEAAENGMVSRNNKVKINSGVSSHIPYLCQDVDWNEIQAED